MRVSAGYWANTKPTRIQVRVSICNTKLARNLQNYPQWGGGRGLAGGFGRICEFAGTIAIPRFGGKVILCFTVV